MRRNVLLLLISSVFLSAAAPAKAQTLKVGVFDLDLMVQAMPGYHIVDSLVQIYESDSLGAEYEYNQMEYARLDSMYKADSAQVAEGKKSKSLFDIVAQKRREMAMNLVYWQQIARNKSDNKRGQLAQPLYQVVANVYKKVLDRKKYTLVLKPNTYEAGFAIDNIFIAVARELKMESLPQELLYVGNDPDPVKQPAAKAPATKPPATAAPKK